MSLKIKPFKTDKDDIELREYMKSNSIPAFPESIFMVGASKSGKSTLLDNLMRREDFYKGYHDLIYLFAKTAKLDKGFKRLKIPKHRLFDKESEMIKSMEIIFEAQKKRVENDGAAKSKKILMIFEDLTSNKKLMANPTFLDLWVLGRHANIQVIASIHKYKALPRTQRLQAMNIIYFRGSTDETNQLVDDWTPPGYSKKEFLEIVNYATKPDNESSHNFLYIAKLLPFEIRYRKNFETILKLTK